MCANAAWACQTIGTPYNEAAMSLKVHLLNIFSPSDPLEIAELHSQLDPGIEVTTGDALPEPADFHILVAGRPTHAQLAASPNLQALIIPFAGLPEPTRQLMTEFPHVAVHNLHHNSAQTAEMAIALLMAAARRIVPVDRQFRQHDWTPRYEPLPEVILDGGTALILGYGAIGQRVARVCQALGMHILAVRRHVHAPAPADIDAEIHPPEDMHQLLPQANALIITLPQTDATEGLIGAAELDMLPRGALLVNVGRGTIVEEAALYQALRDGRLAAAGLDVWYRYPERPAERALTPPAHFPFHEMDNVVMSPHRGGAFGTRYTERARMTHLARLLNAAARGKPIPNRVNLAVGY
jgi:phosphoglycerate dehydrogenase-like enzyme